MEIQRFFAGRTGSYSLPDGEPASFVVHDIGRLKLSSGRLAIGETSSLGSPVVVNVPPGEYRVEVTSAEVDEYYDISESRFAYVSVLLSENEPVSIEPALVEPETVQWRSEPAGGLAGVAGLHGITMSQVSCLALADAAALPEGMTGAPDTWYSTVFDTQAGGMFERMDSDEARPRGTLNAALPETKSNDRLILVIARELQYPILATKDQNGELTGIHIDMLVVGELSEALEAFEGQTAAAKYILEEAMRAEVLAEEGAERRNRGFTGLLRRVFGDT